MSSFTVFSY